jgi:hypothetical protein
MSYRRLGESSSPRPDGNSLDARSDLTDLLNLRETAYVKRNSVAQIEPPDQIDAL